MPTRRRSSSKRKCPRGMIRRKSFTNKRGARVRSSCVKDRGAPGRGPRTLPKYKKGSLPKYRLEDAEMSRRQRLRSIAKKRGCIKTLREVNLLRNYNTRGSSNYKKLSKDVKYIESLCRRGV